MKRMILLMTLFLSTSMFVACADDTPDPGNNNSLSDIDTDLADAGTDSEDEGDPDVEDFDVEESDTDESDVDDPDGGEPDADEPDVCVPTVTECSADQCGQIDNGCGEMIECAPCPCEAGVVSVESCGVCGLGKRSCGSDESGFGTCSAPEIPGVAADADDATCALKLVFVDASAAAGGGGTKEAPFSTYADAVAAANAGQVILLGGQAVFGEPIIVESGVSVIGGFSAAPQFQWNASNRAIFEVAAPDDSAVFGIKAEEINQDTLVANVDVTTADADEMQSNYGAYVFESDNLSLRGVVVQAGKGGAGASGVDGAPGADGMNGQDGIDMTVESPGPGTFYFEIPKGGINTECAVANGGDGGQGWYSAGQSGNIPAKHGESTSGAGGGSAGYDYLGRENGGDGDNGQALAGAVMHGDGGISGGQIMNNLWKPHSAGTGQDGQRGLHGHGGGGGGGAYKNSDTIAAPPGGGGGAGGCGGHPGTGGQPGGGSFGLLLVRSNISIVDSKFQADLGGIGGNGGLGGLGGNGGLGGLGMTKQFQSSSTGPSGEFGTLPWSSGDGGDGSSGNEGGAGGGGGGGVSFGVYCSQSRISEDGQVEYLSGGSARGGQSDGNLGAGGISKDSEGCI